MYFSTLILFYDDGMSLNDEMRIHIANPNLLGVEVELLWLYISPSPSFLPWLKLVLLSYNFM